MASILAIISKAVFEKMTKGASPKIGDVLPIELYASQNAALRPLEDGGSLFLVTVRPGEELWLVGVLDSPEHDDDGWTAAKNTTPIRDLASVKDKLRFSTNTGIKAKPGALGMSLQTPRQLTDADVELLRGSQGAEPEKKDKKEKTEKKKAEGPWTVVASAKLGSRPFRLATCGKDRWLVQGKPGDAVTLLDADLSVAARLPSKAWGQVSASSDGKRVGVATIGAIHVLGADGKREVALDTTEWWEHTSGGVVFADGGKHAWFTCMPDEEEDEVEGRYAFGVLDIARKKRIGLVPVEFDHEGHLWLYPRSDGTSAVLWGNAQQDAQEYWLVTGIDGEAQVEPLEGPSGSGFTEHLDTDDAIIVTDLRSVTWHSSDDGEELRSISFEGALDEGEDIGAVAPLADGSLLLVRERFAEQTSRLALGALDGTLTELAADGLPAGRPTLLRVGSEGRVLVGYVDGTIALLRSRRSVD